MSCYEWESGEIIIPARQWKSFVEGLMARIDEKDVRVTPDGLTTIACDDDGTIVLKPARHSVYWGVMENNHAREHARATKNAQALFSALGRIKWVRGSGGSIVGNDEYHRDDREIGGGGNYEVAYYGPPRKRRSIRGLY
jgi:hypothetical protein